MTRDRYGETVDHDQDQDAVIVHLHPHRQPRGPEPVSTPEDAHRWLQHIRNLLAEKRTAP
jgi:hypothetical protein